jgi:signal transduction histidine kinase
VTALGKLFRTTAFRLTLVYLFVFALFAAFLLVYVAFNMRRLITEQITSTVDAEIGGLAEQYNQGGIRRLVFVIEQRSRRPGSSIYLVTSPTGEGIAGNIGALAPGILDRPGWIETAYRRSEEKEAADNQALARVFILPGGFRLLVGRDLEERERVYSIVESAGRWSVAVVVILGIAGGVFVSRRVLTRIDAMTQTAQTIMAGNLSGRLPVGKSGDELDRLAVNLNDMLERIEALMQGLKEVSDNVAHDLKTPLTRLHNRCEEALRTAKTETEFRSALEETIAESDEIIRTFNALLLIARTESGGVRDNMTEFDAADVVRDVAELYEPVAEEAGLALKVEAAPTPMKGNRELVSQALANLLDNAIKYAAPAGKPLNGATPEIAITSGETDNGIHLSVSDRGPGIPETDRERVIGRFVRLEQSRTKPGSGLGLSLASAVARLHGGKLRLEENAPGLRVTLDLPRSQNASAA